MRTRVLSTVVALFFVFAFAAPLLAADPAGKGNPQTLCPVMGGKIDKKVYADYQGKRVYFCCSSCREDFKKDPEKYIKKLEDQGVAIEKAPDAK
jgi:YHS domain-containing protein